MQAGARSLLKASKADEESVIKISMAKAGDGNLSPSPARSPNRSPRKAKKDVVDLAQEYIESTHDRNQ